jgi:hypothetical protein
VGFLEARRTSERIQQNEKLSLQVILQFLTKSLIDRSFSGRRESPSVLQRNQRIQVANGFASRLILIATSARVRRLGGAPMLPALEISFALWGMIVCAEIEVAQIFQSVLKILQ